MKLQFCKELYSKTALLKAAYNFTDRGFVHLDSDDRYYYVSIEQKDDQKEISSQDFLNEMLVQAVRHEVYLQTKNIRELMLARAMATSILAENDESNDDGYESYSEDAVLRDWFDDEDA